MNPVSERQGLFIVTNFDCDVRIFLTKITFGWKTFEVILRQKNESHFGNVKILSWQLDAVGRNVKILVCCLQTSKPNPIYYIPLLNTTFSFFFPPTGLATLSLALSCYRCDSTIQNQHGVPLCSDFDYSDRFIVECNNSTFCMKKTYTVNLKGECFVW